MTCQLCGEEITGSYARLKKFGFDEYATFHVENGSGRTGSCWEMWMEQNSTYPKFYGLTALPNGPSNPKAHPRR